MDFPLIVGFILFIQAMEDLGVGYYEGFFAI